MIHNFDTSGFQPVGEREWQNPHTLDTIAVKYVDKPLNEPIWLEDVPGMQRSLAHGYAPHGCLIEATPLLLGGVPAVYQLAKMPHPGQPTGAVFMSSIYLAKATCYAVLIYSAPEMGITGMRETQLYVQLGMPKNWGLPHPYDPALESKLPFHRGDDPAWDPQFPDHPLTRTRAWVARAVPAAAVDPGFAALPDFTPSRPASAATAPPADPGWQSLLDDLPKLLGEGEQGNRVWIADSGRGVLFSGQADGVEVSVRIPADQGEAERLNSVVQSQPSGIWRVEQRMNGAVQLWVHTASPGHQDQVPASVVAVLRDGLAADPARLRVRTWGEGGPTAGGHGQRPDRPSAAGLPATCTDWEEFAVRLDWVLQTLPSNAALILNVPNVNWAFVQFWKQRYLVSESSPQDVAGLGGAEFHRRMTGLGWRPGQDAQSNWTGPADNTDHGTSGAPARAVRTFRDVFGVAGPQALTFTAFRDGHPDSLDYLAAELGVVRAK